MTASETPEADLPIAEESAGQADKPVRQYRFSRRIDILSDPESVRAESIRALRTHIVAQHVRLGRRSVAVCAPSEGVGSAYVALSLALAVAQGGQKTLLIDGNMRHPRIGEYIEGLRADQGLYQCLTNPDLNPHEFIDQDVIPNLSILSAGAASPYAQELLAGTGFKDLIDSCLRNYELTIVDTPAANRFADARRIASVLRYALIVVGRDQTYVSDVRALARELQSDHTAMIGAFINDV